MSQALGRATALGYRLYRETADDRKADAFYCAVCGRDASVEDWVETNGYCVCRTEGGVRGELCPRIDQG